MANMSTPAELGRAFGDGLGHEWQGRWSRLRGVSHYVWLQSKRVGLSFPPKIKRLNPPGHHIWSGRFWRRDAELIRKIIILPTVVFASFRHSGEGLIEPVINMQLMSDSCSAGLGCSACVLQHREFLSFYLARNLEFIHFLFFLCRTLNSHSWGTRTVSHSLMNVSIARVLFNKPAGGGKRSRLLLRSPKVWAGSPIVCPLVFADY